MQAYLQPHAGITLTLFMSFAGFFILIAATARSAVGAAALSLAFVDNYSCRRNYNSRCEDADKDVIPNIHCSPPK